MAKRTEKVTLESLAATLDQRFDAMDTKIDNIAAGLNNRIDDLAGMIKLQFDEHTERFDQISERLDRVDKKIGNIEGSMVTKDYLDRKLVKFAAVNNLLLRDEQ